MGTYSAVAIAINPPPFCSVCGYLNLLGDTEMNVIRFNFESLLVRVVEQNGEPWFVAKDVAEALGYAKPENAIPRHCKAGITTPKQGGGLWTLIPERDVYRLIMRSKLKSAEAFEEWVVGEVLPTIRKTGAYSQQQAPALPDFTNPAEAARAWADQHEAATQAKALAQEMKPKVEALDRIATSDGSFCITNAAKQLQVRPKELFGWLSQNKWIYRRPGGGGWVAYQSQIQFGRLEHKVTVITKDDESERVVEQVRVTPRGLAHLSEVIAL